MKFLYFCGLLITLSQIVLAGPDKTSKRNIKSKYVSRACTTVVADYEFGMEAKSSKIKQCSYAPMLGTILICMANEMGPETKGFQNSLKTLASTCKSYKKNYTIAELNKIYTNATEYVLDLTDYDENIKKLENVTYYQPIIMAGDDVQNWMRYYKSYYYNMDNASLFAGILWCYFAGVFLLVGLLNFVKRLGYHRRFNDKYTKWFRANISMPGLFNGKHTAPPEYLKIFTGLIPTRLESIIVIIFLFLNGLLLGFHYDFGSPIFAKKRQIMVMLAVRSGIMAFGLVPLLILFAGRNNILTSLTGIPYTSFIVFHKYVARMMWIHALVHSAGYTAYGVYANRLARYFTRWYFRWGVVATICGAFLLLQAFRCLRTKSYEAFLVIHIVLAVMFIVACWYHCYDIGWLEWIYASWAVWGFDRLLRVIRMSIFGFRNANVELIADDTFKVSVVHNKWFQPFPGCFVYAYFITPTTFWESHPFTIIDSAINENEVTIYIKTKSGVTNRINKQLAKSHNNKTMKICLEGPYGHRVPMEKYDTATLIAGGNGIPAPYYHAIDLSKRESSSKQQIKLTWVIRNPDSIFWFYKELMNLSETNVQTDLYITGKVPVTELNSSNEEEKDNSTSEESVKQLDLEKIISELSGHIQFHYGRPDFNTVLTNELIENGKRNVGIMTCGPPKMVDCIRNLVAESLMKAEGRVDLFEELQTW